MTHGEFAILTLEKAAMAPTNEWKIVMLFYAALHAVNHVVYRGADVTDRIRHEERDTDMVREQRLRPSAPKYRELKTLSETARYKPYDHPMGEAKVSHAEGLARGIVRAAGLLT